MLAMFAQLARYNRWANARLYGAALALDEEAYRRDRGAFVRGMNGTLNHLLVTDRIWPKRLSAQGKHPNRLDASLHEDRRALCLARADEDDRIVRVIDGFDDAALDGCLSMRRPRASISSSGVVRFWRIYSTTQTHHRGQAHMILSSGDSGSTEKQPPVRA